jgi:hypothetical protein
MVLYKNHFTVTCEYNKDEMIKTLILSLMSILDLQSQEGMYNSIEILNCTHK